MLVRSHLVPLSEAVEKADVFGARAARLGRMNNLGLPVPPGVVLDFEMVRAIAEGGPIPDISTHLKGLLALRSSPGDSSWGGPPTILNIGMCDEALPDLSKRIGAAGALEIYRRAIMGYGVRVCGIDPEVFEILYFDMLRKSPTPDAAALRAVVDASLVLFEDETDESFPQAPEVQLQGALKAMARAWNSPTARILRHAKGAHADAGLALIIEEMAFGIGGENCGSGIIQFVEDSSGAPGITGQFLPESQGTDVQLGARTAQLITRAEREANGQIAPSLEELAPSALATLIEVGDQAAIGLGDAFRLSFTLEQGKVVVLDAEPTRRTARASVRIAVDLAQRGAISREAAILRIEPRNLIETLHPQIDPKARRDVFGSGLPASPGAGTGRIVFTSDAAMAAAAQGMACILVRMETSPEDIRGMHAATGVLTVRGGMTSHAAVIARGLGLPCVVGASDLRLNTMGRTLTSADGRVFIEGDMITVDGTSGQALAGAPATIPAATSGAFDTLMAWADEMRTIGVRANADTPQDAMVARAFKVDGIGLCRTEHMFFDEGRITVMREMILAETVEDRVNALTRLLPMQRADFEELFEIMAGLPVTIRLLDPPLHEFLPHEAEGLTRLAEAMNMPVDVVTARARDLAEVNPMLGKRGVRLGITMPEIYDMQARAIFEAAAAVGARKGETVIPEIMIPLVSANREAELVKARVDAVAEAVRAETGMALIYKIGVMVETPRGALRAGDLARTSSFLSFGTNDLTQMTYGLSRDDAGRFMRDYVNKGVFPEDPFHTLDIEGVGELMLLAAKRGRAENPDLVLGLCGEHGGDPASVQFCKLAGFDYVSCSPFRVPIARLAAAQASLLAEKSG